MAGHLVVLRPGKKLIARRGLLRPQRLEIKLHKLAIEGIDWTSLIRGSSVGDVHLLRTKVVHSQVCGVAVRTSPRAQVRFVRRLPVSAMDMISRMAF